MPKENFETFVSAAVSFGAGAASEPLITAGCVLASVGVGWLFILKFIEHPWLFLLTSALICFALRLLQAVICGEIAQKVRPPLHRALSQPPFELLQKSVDKVKGPMFDCIRLFALASLNLEEESRRQLLDELDQDLRKNVFRRPALYLLPPLARQFIGSDSLSERAQLPGSTLMTPRTPGSALSTPRCPGPTLLTPRCPGSTLRTPRGLPLVSPRPTTTTRTTGLSMKPTSKCAESDADTEEDDGSQCGMDTSTEEEEVSEEENINHSYGKLENRFDDACLTPKVSVQMISDMLGRATSTKALPPSIQKLVHAKAAIAAKHTIVEAVGVMYDAFLRELIETTVGKAAAATDAMRQNDVVRGTCVFTCAAIKLSLLPARCTWSVFSAVVGRSPVMDSPQVPQCVSDSVDNTTNKLN